MKRAPTPPVDAAAEADDSTDSDEWGPDFDADNTVTIVSPSEKAVQQPRLDTDIASWKPRELRRVDSDTLSPVIDLDAALGPFNTPDGTVQRGSKAHRRTLHSADRKSVV